MSVQHFRAARSLFFCVAIGSMLVEVGQADDPSAPSWLKIPLGKQATPGAAPSQLLGALGSVLRGSPWSPEVSDERPRGAALDVYPKCAPTVVVVRTSNAHGTGFFISEDGWIVTNQHVVDGAEIDLENGARRLAIYVGKLNKDERMVLDPTPLAAHVYVADEVKDLALLKLIQLPKGKKLPAVPPCKVLLSTCGINPGGDGVVERAPAREDPRDPLQRGVLGGAVPVARCLKARTQTVSRSSAKTPAAAVCLAKSRGAFSIPRGPRASRRQWGDNRKT